MFYLLVYTLYWTLPFDGFHSDQLNPAKEQKTTVIIIDPRYIDSELSTQALETLIAIRFRSAQPASKLSFFYFPFETPFSFPLLNERTSQILVPVPFDSIPCPAVIFCTTPLNATITWPSCSVPVHLEARIIQVLQQFHSLPELSSTSRWTWVFIRVCHARSTRELPKVVIRFNSNSTNSTQHSCNYGGTQR